MKDKLFEQCKCKTCKYVVVKDDKLFTKRISCPYSSNKEFLGDFCDETLVECCNHYKLKKQE